MNFNQPATRGEIATFIHQTLVNQGRLEPLPADQAVSSYIVNGTTQPVEQVQTIFRHGDVRFNFTNDIPISGTGPIEIGGSISMQKHHG